MRKTLFALLLVAGCGGAGKDPPTTPDPQNEEDPVESDSTCESAAINVVSELGAELDGDKKGRIQTLIVTSCHEDAWPQAAIDCADQSHGDELEHCNQYLPQDISEKVGEQIRAILDEGNGGTVEEPPPAD